MKTIHTHTFTNPIQFPKFWDEDWLKVAIDELDSRKMTPDEKASLEILIARNAESVKAESRKINQAREAEKVKIIQNALKIGLTVQQCALLVSVSEDFVKAIQQQLSAS